MVGKIRYGMIKNKFLDGKSNITKISENDNLYASCIPIRYHRFFK